MKKSHVKTHLKFVKEQLYISHTEWNNIFHLLRPLKITVCKKKNEELKPKNTV